MTKEKIKKKRGRPSKVDLELRAREAEKQKIIEWAVVIGIILVIGIFSSKR